MPRRTPLLALACAAPFAGAAQSPPPALAPTQWAQLSLRERVIIRIPRVAPPSSRMGPTSRIAPGVRAPVQWKEHRGPRCVAMADLAGALVSPDGDVDLVTAHGNRLRAKLGEDCAAFDFYSGFYVKPTGDGQLCADRDAIRARSGRSCPIERFRTLTAKRAKP